MDFKFSVVELMWRIWSWPMHEVRSSQETVQIVGGSGGTSVEKDLLQVLCRGMAFYGDIVGLGLVSVRYVVI